VPTPAPQRILDTSHRQAAIQAGPEPAQVLKPLGAEHLLQAGILREAVDRCAIASDRSDDEARPTRTPEQLGLQDHKQPGARLALGVQTPDLGELTGRGADRERLGTVTNVLLEPVDGLLRSPEPDTGLHGGPGIPHGGSVLELLDRLEDLLRQGAGVHRW